VSTVVCIRSCCSKRAMNNGITSISSMGGTGWRHFIAQWRSPGDEFQARSSRLSSRKGWIAHGSKAKGGIYIDEVQLRALRHGGKSLLPSGIMSLTGSSRPAQQSTVSTPWETGSRKGSQTILFGDREDKGRKPQRSTSSLATDTPMR